MLAVDVQARILRDDRVRPGGEGVVELPGEILFVVSADGVSEQGADGLQRAWSWYIERGIWRYRRGGPPIRRVTYHLVDLDGAVCEIESGGGIVETFVSSAHFSRGSVNGLQTAVRASVRAGWEYHPARCAL